MKAEQKLARVDIAEEMEHIQNRGESPMETVRRQAVQIEILLVQDHQIQEKWAACMTALKKARAALREGR